MKVLFLAILGALPLLYFNCSRAENHYDASSSVDNANSAPEKITCSLSWAGITYQAVVHPDGAVETDCRYDHIDGLQILNIECPEELPLLMNIVVKVREADGRAMVWNTYERIEKINESRPDCLVGN